MSSVEHRELGPERIGPYELLHPLGRGNLGSVYLARDMGTDVSVALKVLDLDAFADGPREVARRALAAGADAAAGLVHENVACILAVALDEPVPYIAMRRVYNGRSLARYCEAGQLLRLEEAVRIAKACAVGLHFAHERGVVHGDLKPRNVLLEAGLEPRIVDFGLSAVTAPLPARSPRYLSPEQVKGEGPGPASDIFNLGVMLYELLAGRHPFPASSEAEQHERIRRERHVPLRKLRSDIPVELQVITSRCLAKRSANRYPTALHLAADLDVVLDILAASASGAARRKLYEQVRALEYFSGFSDQELNETLRHCAVRRFRSGDEVIAMGDEAPCVYVVLEGEVGVRREEVFEIAYLGVGECVGELGALTGTPRTATVIALDRCTLLSIPVSFLEHGPLACQVRLKTALLQVLARRLVSALGSVC